MKRMAVMLCIFAMMTGLCGCSCTADVSDVEILPWEESKLYSMEEIQSAINEAIGYFQQNFEGCTLTEITYAGDDKTAAHAEWAQRHDADEVIVLISSFDVDSSGGDGSLNPDSTYSGWMWILVREESGSWKHADHGY